jgi:hypothetical protein
MKGNESVSLLSRAFGVQPRRAHAVRIQRDLVIPARLKQPARGRRLVAAK